MTKTLDFAIQYKQKLLYRSLTGIGPGILHISPLQISDPQAKKTLDFADDYLPKLLIRWVSTHITFIIT